MRALRHIFILFILLGVSGLLVCGYTVEQFDVATNSQPSTPDSIPLTDEPRILDHITTERIQPDALEYLGAFRMPESSIDERQSFAWGGEAMTYYPGGNGGRGSLYVSGHNWHTYIAEISIPAPLIADDVDDMHRAEIIQPLTNIHGDLFDAMQIEIPRVGLAVVDDMLYYCWGAHNQDVPDVGTHGWHPLDLHQPGGGHAWRIQTPIYSINDYMFPVPSPWREQWDMDIISGRFRDGGLDGMGPAMYGIRSMDLRNGVPGTIISAKPLIQYDDVREGEDGPQLDGYSHADAWTGGVWIAEEGQSAILLWGTHGVGNTWYGFSNGVVYPTSGDPGEVYPTVPPWPHDERGWWNDDFRAVCLFFDPMDLIEMEPNEVQPYAVADWTDYMMMEQDETVMRYTGAAAYDPNSQRIFVQELQVDEDAPIIHVFQWEAPSP